jgi:hypothetical protein
MTRAHRQVQIIQYDHAATAKEYRLGAGRERSRARTQARNADRWYKAARSQRRHAAWLTKRPDLWDEDLDPAATERNARIYVRIADGYLRGYFSALNRAKAYTRLAGRYEEMDRG